MEALVRRQLNAALVLGGSFLGHPSWQAWFLRSSSQRQKLQVGQIPTTVDGGEVPKLWVVVGIGLFSALVIAGA